MAFVSLPAGLPSRSIGVRRGGACPLHAADRRRAAQWASGVSSNRAVRSPCLSRLLPAVHRQCVVPTLFSFNGGTSRTVALAMRREIHGRLPCLLRLVLRPDTYLSRTRFVVVPRLYMPFVIL